MPHQQGLSEYRPVGTRVSKSYRQPFFGEPQLLFEPVSIQILRINPIKQTGPTAYDAIAKTPQCNLRNWLVLAVPYASHSVTLAYLAKHDNRSSVEGGGALQCQLRLPESFRKRTRAIVLKIKRVHHSE